MTEEIVIDNSEPLSETIVIKEKTYTEKAKRKRRTSAEVAEAKKKKADLKLLRDTVTESVEDKIIKYKQRNGRDNDKNTKYIHGEYKLQDLLNQINQILAGRGTVNYNKLDETICVKTNIGVTHSHNINQDPKWIIRHVKAIPKSKGAVGIGSMTDSVF